MSSLFASLYASLSELRRAVSNCVQIISDALCIPKSRPTSRHERNLKTRFPALKRWRTMRGVVWPARRKPRRILLKGLPFWPARLQGKGRRRKRRKSLMKLLGLLLLSGLIEACARASLRGTQARFAASKSRLAPLRGWPASLRATALLGCLLTFGCAARQPAVPVMPDCPAPPVPELPALISGEPLDSLANVRILMERDDCMRLYVRGLEDALECYKKTGDNYGPASNGGSFANP